MIRNPPLRLYEIARARWKNRELHSRRNEFVAGKLSEGWTLRLRRLLPASSSAAFAGGVTPGNDSKGPVESL